ncbi:MULTISPECIES: preprotein translocase subunit YajC [Aliivibrio]|jgi:preprotein translocase subunit YajC|uniref:Sec translocon accessory complex subunit YajC n=3 Tax=Aliivibrio TaxID=511678 RepID=A0A1B9NXR6_ALILO|nr:MULTISPECIES: preprotein translocase subunit YajC [Aliivibrio]AZL85569.1 preprotein translocase subunit YajC [Aliivibrio salmonicida]MBB1313850.1 preprotein translocase subunit YajC [Aliivibrio sp. SR45-2]OCH20514.1 preprotein translocase subunit YajC [Aliivibrio logei]OEF20008.1 preprotein translocase subunit YajC [Aliivibrio logei 5S-186]CAQ80118.1 putative membrane subunit of preprotein translocase [Aliivibrio salmonicida LFI1238]
MNFFSQAHAAGEAGAQGGGMQMFIMLGMFAVIFYFMIYRPQAKRQKEHKNLMSSMGKGDEVLTAGGLVGKITKASDENDYIVIELNANNEVTIKKDFVSAVLPKGTLKSL